MSSDATVNRYMYLLGYTCPNLCTCRGDTCKYGIIIPELPSNAQSWGHFVEYSVYYAHFQNAEQVQEKDRINQTRIYPCRIYRKGDLLVSGC